jgi:DNA-binding NtrC family response regulator
VKNAACGIFHVPRSGEEDSAVDTFNVLLVDDEIDFLETLTKRLKKRNLNTLSANTGVRALEILKQEPIDVVVLDVKMPDMDGIDTLKEIKKINPLIEVIMLSGHANMEIAIEGMELGAFDYLMKPMSTDELLYKLQDAYKKKVIQQKRVKNLQEVIK